MAIFDYSVKTTKDIFLEFNTNGATGLSKKESAKRLGIYGLNHFETGKFSALKIFLRQFKSAFIYLLLLAVVITSALREYTDAVMILIFLAVNSLATN